MRHTRTALITAVVWTGYLTLQSVAAGDTLLERGTYLMQSIVACGNCHTPKDKGQPITGMELAGGFVIEEKPFTAINPNITPDKETGIGSWTDEEIKRAITQGVRKSGEPMLPPMAYAWYRHITPEDLDALVAYLRSLAPLPAVRTVRLIPPKKE
jgi:mono/diheme cytochrome c family protein